MSTKGSSVLARLSALLTKDMVDVTPYGKNSVDITYEDGECVRVTILRLDPPRGEVLN